MLQLYKTKNGGYSDLFLRSMLKITDLTQHELNRNSQNKGQSN